MFVNHISHDDECGLHAWPWKMDRIGVIILTASYLSLTISQQLAQSTSRPSSSLPPTNTGGRLDSFNWALLSSSISSSSTSLRTSGSKVGKFSRFLRTSLLGDACNSGLIYVNDFSNCLSSGSFLMYSPIAM